jgi:anthranilate phosphoribosyltransferase
VVIPTYNGARKMANLTPLLACCWRAKACRCWCTAWPPTLAAWHGGSVCRAGRAGGAPPLEAEEAMSQRKPAFITIDTMAPKLAYLLSLRRKLGVRNSTHTLVKIMQPFAGPALRLVSYTHPEYLEMLGEYFTTAAPHDRGDAFLMRGTEGETVANANKAQQIDWFHGGLRTTLVPKQTLVGELPLLENKDAATTAAWIKSVLDGEVPVPPPIAEQVAQCLLVSRTWPRASM